MGDGTSRLPIGVRAHPAQTPLSFREDGVVEVTRSLEVGGKKAGLLLVHLDGQLDLKRRAGFRTRLLLFLMNAAFSPCASAMGLKAAAFGNLAQAAERS